MDGTRLIYLHTTVQKHTKDMDYKKLATTVLDTELRSLSKMHSIFDETFCQVVELLVSCPGRIIITGIGKSGLIAKKLASTLASIGRATFFIHASEASHGDLGAITKEDTLMLLSNSGESLEMISVTRYCKTLQVPIIAITGNQNSTLHKSADIGIVLPGIEEVSSLKIPSTSTTMMSVLGDAFVACVIEALGVTKDDYKMYHPAGKIGASLTKISAIMRTNDAVPTVESGTQLADAIIKMSEKALGCILVKNKEDKLLGIITDGDLRRHFKKGALESVVDCVMTKNPKTLSPQMYVSEAIEFMSINHITNVIVTENGCIVGVLHIHDCLKPEMIKLDA